MRGALWAGWSGAIDRTCHPAFFLKAFNGENVEALPIGGSAGELFELEEQMAMLVRAVRDGEQPAATGGGWQMGGQDVSGCRAVG